MTEEKTAEKQEKERELIIDATNAVFGRLASFAAKQALLGHKIIIVNSENAVVIGNRDDILEDFRQKRKRGRGSLKGPYYPRSPEALLKRAIRGMLSYKKHRGADAFKRVKCFQDVPEKFINAKKITSKEKEKKYLTLKEISRLI